MDVGSREAQMEAMRDLRASLEAKGIGVELVADEWCNTLKMLNTLLITRLTYDPSENSDLGGVNNTIEALVYCNEVE